MKLCRLLCALLFLCVGSAAELCGQTADAERRQFAAIKAKADKGDAEAQLSVASFYARGIGVTKDPGKSTKWLRKAAEQGLARAQRLLGWNLANGVGVKMNRVEAAQWLRRAAEQGLAEAQFDLGTCYANGDGVERNAAEAAAWYRQAANQALPDAEAELGNCYLEGNGVPKDIPEGVKLVRKAAERGFGPAQNTLGLCYARGNGVTKDHVEAYKWFNLAVAKGGALADDAKVNLAGVERFLTPEQVAEGQRLAREFNPGEASPPPGVDRTPAASPSNNTPAPSTGGKAGIVTVMAPDDACEIYVDGGFVGHTPARVRLKAGPHVVEVRKAGFKTYQKNLQVSEGAELTLRAVLDKE
ncbi:MAG TPA: PEGA domain-containing protein [Candidatus Paceibacterota bacterium]|nr:PEGA domain-containing protein [Verrucomicrobiota bacterium]HSA09022.1 PEGA domain-containing protein [Candidatus Paceibacterota bacterium]